MKYFVWLAVTTSIIATLACGCAAMLGNKASPSSPPVITGAATTNDPVAVAYVKLAREVNSAVNVTPTAPLVNDLLIGLTAVLSAAAGYYTRHQAAKGEVKLALQVPVAAASEKNS